MEATSALRQDLPMVDGVALVAPATSEREKSLLRRMMATTSGVLAFTGDKCSPLLQQLPFRFSSPAISRLQVGRLLLGYQHKPVLASDVSQCA